MEHTYLIFVISFTQAAFSNSKFYTQQFTKITPKHSKMSLKSKLYAFFVGMGTYWLFFNSDVCIFPSRVPLVK